MDRAVVPADQLCGPLRRDQLRPRPGRVDAASQLAEPFGDGDDAGGVRVVRDLGPEVDDRARRIEEPGPDQLGGPDAARGGSPSLAALDVACGVAGNRRDARHRVEVVVRDVDAYALSAAGRRGCDRRRVLRFQPSQRRAIRLRDGPPNATPATSAWNSRAGAGGQPPDPW